MQGGRGLDAVLGLVSDLCPCLDRGDSGMTSLRGLLRLDYGGQKSSCRRLV